MTVSDFTMWTTASVLGLLCVFPLLTTACDNSDPCQFTGGDAFSATNEVPSSNGGLAHTLTVDISDVTIEWLTVQRRTYNGGFPGPTFRLKAGDDLNITLVNNLGPQPAGEHNEFRDPNTTNLHTHGLHISPLEPQDYVLLEVGPGETYEYKFQLNADQQAGTFWYHAHHHGSTFFQCSLKLRANTLASAELDHEKVASGLAGLLIVEDEPSSMSAELAAISCPNNCNKEVPMLLGNFIEYSGGGATFASVQEDIGDPFTLDDTVVTTAGVTLNAYLTDQQTGVSAYMVNVAFMSGERQQLTTGLRALPMHVLIFLPSPSPCTGQVRPLITMQPGEIRRFRMVNAGPSDMLLLTITGCEITILAYDGVYVDTPYSQDFIFIPTGGRCDAAVRCATAGTYEMRSGEDAAHEPSIGDTGIYGGVIATIEVTGASVSMNFPTATPAKPSYLDDLQNVANSSIGGRYVVELGPTPFLNREQFTNTTYFRYNFDVDTIQQWVFVNSDEDSGHPLHMHVNHFQVISYNPYNGAVTDHLLVDAAGNLCDQQHRDFDPNAIVADPVTVDTTYLGHDTNDRNLAGYARIREFRDVLLIPPLASVTVRFKATDYIGPYVLHCHILNHEDEGMMMVTYSTPSGQATASPWESSGGHNPGTCKATDVYPDILQNSSDGNKHAVSDTRQKSCTLYEKCTAITRMSSQRFRVAQSVARSAHTPEVAGSNPPHVTDLVPLGKALYTTFLTSLRRYSPVPGTRSPCASLGCHLSIHTDMECWFRLRKGTKGNGNTARTDFTMWTTASVLGLLCVFPLLTTACDNSDPCQFTGGDAFVPTAEVTSSNGGLAHTLTVDISDVTIEWLTVQRRTYNGGFPGPTFRLKAGDNFDVTLVNNLGPQPAGVHNDFRQPNTTNLHLHGLHISPLEPQDYVLLEVGPGDRYEFKFELNADQQAGTFWYHSHYHGSTFFQVRLQPSPVTHPEPSPVTHPEPSPVTHPEPSPVTHPEPSPVTHPEPSPVTHSEPSPVTHPEPFPVTHSEPSPVTHPEPSPVTHSEPSPVTHSEPSPVTHPEPSPVTHSEPSPVTHSEPSPVKHSEPSYDQLMLAQVASGMAGLLIVEDEPSSMSAELAAISCPDNCDKEVPMLLGNFLYYSGGDAEVTFATMQNNMGDPFTLDDTVVTTAGVTLNDYLLDQQTGVSAHMVNGQIRPTITMQPGEIRRFRMVNTGPADMLLITIAGCEITILAYDGVYVDTPYSQDFIFIPTGGRCDAAVRCATAGTYEIRSGEDAAHEASIADTVIYGGVLATIQVAGASVSMNFPTATPAKPSHLEDLRTVEDSAIGGRYVVEVGPDPFLNREQFTNITYYRYNFEVDTIQQWVFVNTNEEDGHPLHMHVNHFQVISYNPYNGPVTILGGGGGGSVVGADGATGVEGFAYYDLNGNLCDQQHRLFDPNSLPALPVTVDTTFVGHDTNDRNLAGYARLGEYRDVLLIPPLGSVTVRFKAADYIGPYVLHCHILNHEDQGMMMVTYATPPGQATPSPWEASGGYNPGTCKATDVYPDILQNTSDGNKHAGVNTWLTALLMLMVACLNHF
ncbi:hypothetical protein Bbelb_258950 [Branchiostoma belcheri]|nr:hypothetical protein Bbelb_258950 [Branchiostoma belcheri]